MRIMSSFLLLALVLSMSPALLTQSSIASKTTPLSVCNVHARLEDWDNNIVVLRAHYGSGMEDSFLWDDRCLGKDIQLEQPQFADEEDSTLRARFPTKRQPVSLERNEQLLKFEKIASIRDEKNVMCPKHDVIIEAVGRIDTIRKVSTDNPKCRLTFGMCNYAARFVLQSLTEVAAGSGKAMCK